MADAHMAAKVPDSDTVTIWRQIEKSVLLERLDHYWKEHLATLDALRQVVFLRSYAQKTPLNEYKQEAFTLFQRMLETIREDVTKILSTSEMRFQDPTAWTCRNVTRFPDLARRSVSPARTMPSRIAGGASVLGRTGRGAGRVRCAAGGRSLCGHGPVAQRACAPAGRG